MSRYGDDDAEMERGDYLRDKAIDDELLERAARRPSGRTRTYAEKRSAGLHRVSAELDEPTLRKLDELCADGGMSRADMFRAMIDAEWAEWRGLITSGRKTIAASKRDGGRGGSGEGVG